MNPADRLINRIRDFVNGPEHEATPEITELAGQFKDLCQQLNQRLAQCEEFLRQGRRSEAVHEALTTPSVFELAESLSFPEKSRWLKFCQELELPAPSEINRDVLKQLKNECDKEQLLDPLLREFRRLIHTGERDEKIRVLRRVRSHDPDNQVWIENLEPLEKEELRELQERASQALEDDDEQQISEIIAALQAPWRAVAPDAEVLEQLQQRLHKNRQKAIAEEAEKILTDLNRRKEQQDFEGLGRGLRSWHRLLETTGFTPDEQMRRQAAEADNFYQSEVQQRQRSQHYQHQLQKLNQLLASAEPEPEKVRSLWNQLQELTDNPPPEVAEKVQNTLNREKERIAALQRRRVFTRVAAAIIILAILMVAGWQTTRWYQVRQGRNKISDLRRQENYQELKNYLLEIGPESPIYQAVNGDSHLEEAREQLALEKERRQQFAQTRSRLEAIAEDNFEKPLKIIESAVARAEDLSGTESEQEWLRNWREQWNQWRDQRRQEISQQFMAELREAQNQLELVKEDQTLTPETRMNKIYQVEELLDDIRQRLDQEELTPSPETRDKLSQLRQDKESLQNSLEDELQIHIELTDTLAGPPGDLDSWAETITAYRQQIPDSALSAELESAADLMTAAWDAVSLTPSPMRRFPRTQEETEDIEARLQQLPAGDKSVWHRPLRQFIDLQENRRQAQARLRELRQLDIYDLEQIRVRRKSEEGWRVYYIAGYFHQQEYETEEGIAATRYWGEVYGLEPESLVAEAERINFNSEEYEVEYSQRSQDNLIPSARYIRSFLTALPDDEDFQEHLLSALDELRKRDDLALIPRARTMEIIADALVKSLPANFDTVSEYRDFLSGVNTDIPWFNHKNEVVQSVEARVRNRMEQLPESARLKQLISLHQRLLLSSLNRDLEYAGVLWPVSNNSENLEPRLIRNNINLVWTPLLSDDNSGYKFIEIDLRNGRQPDLPSAYKLHPGHPLFVPSDNQTARDILNELDPPDEISEDFPWPAPWPLNQRQ